jgi:carbon-monoxide dehydrogenase medium subunit
MRLARPSVLVDLNRIAELGYIRAEPSGLAVGAMTRQRALERDALVAERLPFLRDVTAWIGHPQIRSRGTVGGSLAHADPAAELPAAALALDAELVVAGPSGTRVMAVDDLLLGYLATSLGPADVLVEVRFGWLARGVGWSIQELARRKGDFALVGVLALVCIEQGCLSQPRLAYFGLGGRPRRFADLERWLDGQPADERAFAAAAERASTWVEAHDDLHAPAAYRRAVAGTLTRRALAEASRRATTEVA